MEKGYKRRDIMNNNIQIRAMHTEDIPVALSLWSKQYKLHCNDCAFPDYWSCNTNEIEHVLENQIEQNNAYAAVLNDTVIGFIGYFMFDFHDEKTALCNPTSHAAQEENKERIYLALYKYISKQWIEADIFNHIWIFFYRDEKLKEFLYDLGFGAYAVDAFSRLPLVKLEQESPYSIRLATDTDLSALKPIVDESVTYYIEEPLFLKRDPVSEDELKNLIGRKNIFIATDGDEIIGFININKSSENDIQYLTENGCGLIDELGAYIKPKYRGNKLGEFLLEAISVYCINNDINRVHVDWESANPFANKFWRKHFKPMTLSVRRTINKDANS